jgi:hypothetical protein
MGELIVQTLSFLSLVQLVSVRGDVFGNVLVTGSHGMSEIVGLCRETLVQYITLEWHSEVFLKLTFIMVFH